MLPHIVRAHSAILAALRQPVFIGLVALMALAGCGGTEPESTACPVPTAPEETAPTACPIPAGDDEPLVPEEKAVCEGGALTATQAFEVLSDGAVAAIAIDTRGLKDYEAGHIPGAQLISTADDEFDEKLDALSRDVTYVVYCRRGNVSQGVVKQMLDMDFKHVCHIGSGFYGWQSEGLPVEKGGA